MGIAEAAAAEIERRLSSAEPIVMAIGTGRTLKAAIEQLPPMECPQHKIVSLTGNISPDGSAAFYNVIFTMADRIKARSFPMPLPVIASSPEEREMLLSQPMIQPTLALAAQADVTFVGIGDLGPKAPLYEDGFITEAELKALQKAGGVAEIVGWVFDRDGRLIEGITNDRVAVGAAAVARALAGHRACHGRQQAARHPGRRDTPPGQRPYHRRAHGLRAACGVSRFRKSVSRFSDRNLRQNKRLSRRSVGEATQVCLAIWPSPAPNISGRPRDRRYRQARSG